MVARMNNLWKISPIISYKNGSYNTPFCIEATKWQRYISNIYHPHVSGLNEKICEFPRWSISYNELEQGYNIGMLFI